VRTQSLGGRGQTCTTQSLGGRGQTVSSQPKLAGFRGPTLAAVHRATWYIALVGLQLCARFAVLRFLVYCPCWLAALRLLVYCALCSSSPWPPRSKEGSNPVPSAHELSRRSHRRKTSFSLPSERFLHRQRSWTSSTTPRRRRRRRRGAPSIQRQQPSPCRRGAEDNAE